MTSEKVLASLMFLSNLARAVSMWGRPELPSEAGLRGTANNFACPMFVASFRTLTVLTHDYGALQIT